MQKYVNDIIATSDTGLVPLAGASCTVYIANTLTPAVIYSTNAGAVKDNPFVSSGTGGIEFYAADGRYDLKVEKTGFDDVEVKDILLEDPATASAAVISGGSINNTPIGAATASTGRFSTLVATTSTLGAVNATSLDGAAIGATIPSTGKFTTVEAVGISGSYIVNAAIGGEYDLGSGLTTYAAPGTFTDVVADNVSVTGGISSSDVTTGQLTSTAIGAVIPGTGAFTALSAGTVEATATIGAATRPKGYFSDIDATGIVEGSVFLGAIGGTHTLGESGPVDYSTTGDFTHVNAASATVTTLSAGDIGADVVTAEFITGHINTTGGEVTPYNGRFNDLVVSGDTSTGTIVAGAITSANASLSGGTILGMSVTSPDLNATGGILNNVHIGPTTPASGKFTTLQATAGIDNTVIGATTKAAGTFTTLTADSLNVAGGGLNNISIGATTPSTGKFTTLQATSGLDNTVIGATTKAAGTFTTLTADSLTVTGGLPPVTSVSNIPINRGNTAETNTIAIGTNALDSLTTGTQNIGIGTNALTALTSTNACVAVGYNALAAATGDANTAVGGNAAQSVTTGASNTAVGKNALFTNSAGNSNTAVGANSGIYVTGTGNVAVGTSALMGNAGGVNAANNVAVGNNALSTTGNVTNNVVVGSAAMAGGTVIGSSNTVVGASAMNQATSASSSVAIGSAALLNATTPVNNIAVGASAMMGNATDKVTGSGNVAVGDSAMNAVTTGGSNVAVGASALYYETTGTNNVAVGGNAMFGNATNKVTGNSNVAVGNSSLLSVTTGGSNVAVGANALYYETTGSNNVAVGGSAMFGNTTDKVTGSGNCAIGNNSMLNLTTGSLNTAVGNSSLLSITTGINNFAIGSGSGNDAVRTITTTSNEGVLGNNSTTGIFAKVAVTVTSDERDKTAFTAIPHGLDFVLGLKTGEFKFKDRTTGEETSKARYGFSAQQILAAEGTSPVLVDNTDLDNLKLNETMLIPVLVNAIKELKAELNALKGGV